MVLCVKVLWLNQYFCFAISLSQLFIDSLHQVNLTHGFGLVVFSLGFFVQIGANPSLKYAKNSP